MIWVFYALGVSAGLASLVAAALQRLGWTSDPALKIGVYGLLGLGGTATLAFGIAMVNAPIASYVSQALGVIGIVIGLMRYRSKLAVASPKAAEWIAIAALVFVGIFVLVSAAAPPDTVEWDSLAYHLAVPKLWLEAGRVTPISFIHHSNFPGAVDTLFLVGLKMNEAMAKGFCVAFLLFGILAIFGPARQSYNRAAGWWAAVAFATVPTVLWESGTAYIDMAHGLFAGLGAYLLIRNRDKTELWIGAALLGFAVGSKYTGVLAAGLAALICLLVLIRSKQSLKPLLTAALITTLLGGGWYVKNAAWVGNPVFPFFYSKLGGKNWSSFNSEIYTHEQQTFGVPKSGLDAVGHGILGLAYQPGRYNNPMPELKVVGGTPQGAQGMPIAAMGAALFVSALAWGFSGQAKTQERRQLAWLVLMMLAWAALSQQSRYIVSVAPTLAILLGGAVVRLRAGPIVATLAVLQAGYSLWLMKTARLDLQLPAALGQISRDDFLRQTVGFAADAPSVNQAVKSGKVALYDEVFGYLLDVPYFWANPGHSMELDYAQMSSGEALAKRLKEMEFTHAYVNLSLGGDPAKRFVQAIQPGGEPYTEEEKAAASDPRNKWRILLADAVQSGQLIISPLQLRRGVLLEVGR